MQSSPRGTLLRDSNHKACNFLRNSRKTCVSSGCKAPVNPLGTSSILIPVFMAIARTSGWIWHGAMSTTRKTDLSAMHSSKDLQSTWMYLCMTCLLFQALLSLQSMMLSGKKPLACPSNRSENLCVFPSKIWGSLLFRLGSLQIEAK